MAEPGFELVLSGFKTGTLNDYVEILPSEQSKKAILFLSVLEKPQEVSFHPICRVA